VIEGVVVAQGKVYQRSASPVYFRDNGEEDF